MTEKPFVEIEPPNEFVAPDIPRRITRQFKISLAEVTRLASIGMEPRAIGPNIGLSIRAFGYQWDRKKAIREAYEEGNAIWQKKLLERNQVLVENGNTAALIFSLKQMHGTNWSDQSRLTPEGRENAAQKAFEARQRADKALPSPPKLIPKETAPDA